MHKNDSRPISPANTKKNKNIRLAKALRENLQRRKAVSAERKDTPCPSS